MHHLHFIVNFTMCRPRSCSTSTIESKVQNVHTSEPNAMPPAAPPRGKLKLNPERKREVEMEEGVSEGCNVRRTRFRNSSMPGPCLGSGPSIPGTYDVNVCGNYLMQRASKPNTASIAEELFNIEPAPGSPCVRPRGQPTSRTVTASPRSTTFGQGCHVSEQIIAALQATFPRRVVP